jgi:hypothetical protein
VPSGAGIMVPVAKRSCVSQELMLLPPLCMCQPPLFRQRSNPPRAIFNATVQRGDRHCGSIAAMG